MYPKAVDYVSGLAPSAIHAEFEAPPKCRISLQSPAFSRFQPLKSPTRFHEDPNLFLSKDRDLWILGNRHRLLCDDARHADYARLMGGEQAAMVFTDPPYNVSVPKTVGR